MQSREKPFARLHLASRHICLLFVYGRRRGSRASERMHDAGALSRRETAGEVLSFVPPFSRMPFMEYISYHAGEEL